MLYPGKMAVAASPVRRGPETENEDFESVVQKMLDHNFDDWPNEAGVILHYISFPPPNV